MTSYDISAVSSDMLITGKCNCRALMISALMIGAQQCHPPVSHTCAQLCAHLCPAVPPSCAHQCHPPVPISAAQQC
ncbi:unnamed protein product, partial [Staurois parvus]